MWFDFFLPCFSDENFSMKILFLTKNLPRKYTVHLLFEGTSQKCIFTAQQRETFLIFKLIFIDKNMEFSDMTDKTICNRRAIYIFLINELHVASYSIFLS